MVIVQPHEKVVSAVSVGTRRHTGHTEKSNSAIIVALEEQLVVSMVVHGLQQKRVMIFHQFHRNVGLANIPELNTVGVATHEVVLLVGVVVDVGQAARARAWGQLETVFLATLSHFLPFGLPVVDEDLVLSRVCQVASRWLDTEVLHGAGFSWGAQDLLSRLRLINIEADQLMVQADEYS